MMVVSLKLKNKAMDNVMKLYEFAQHHIIIKDMEGNNQKFSDKQLDEIKEMEDMMNKGYELRYIHSRRGTQLHWIKK